MRFNILQILPNNTKILADKDFNKRLFGEERLVNLSKKFGVSSKNISRYHNGTRAMPLSFLVELIKEREISSEDLQNKLMIKIDKNGEFLRIGPFIEIDSRWVYISELLKGDGHITPNYWYIQFTNKEDSLIHEVRRFFISIGLAEKRFSLNTYRGVKHLTIRSYLLAYLFDKILGVTPGKKSSIIDIKDFVMKDKEFATAAIRGAFDAEGSVTFTGSRRISICSNSKIWIEKLKIILNILRIKSDIYEDKNNRKNPIYRLLIHGIINIKRFNEFIVPVHEKKKDRLQEIISSYWKNPEYIFHKDILLCIKDGINRKKEISDKLDIKLSTIGNNISILRKRELIEPNEKIYSNKGSFFRYNLTKKGMSYLEKELLPFFD